MSRTSTENSRSAAKERAKGVNGSGGDSVTSAAAETTRDEAGDTVPLPAATIGKIKARPSGETADKGQDSARQGNRKTMTSGEKSDSTAPSAGSPAPAEVVQSAVKSGTKTPVTPSEPSRPAPATESTSRPTASASAGRSASSSYSGSSYTGSSPSTPSSYTRSEWAGAGVPAPAAASPAGGAVPNNGYSSGNGFSSSGTASAVGGAAAGLANSVSSAWQRRGSDRGVQARKASKRQAMLTLARVEPWSVMKFSFVASVVAFVILFVAVAVLYMVLSALGVFDSLQNTVSSITSSKSASGTNISHWFSASLILGYTALLGALNIVLITAMATVGSVIYNLIAKTIGGIEVTLRETD
jgi:hypothetical protein